MKKLFVLLMVMIFYLTVFANPVFAGGGYGHGGYGHGSYGHGGYYHHGGYGHGHGYWYGWDAVAIGLGTAIVGTAIINSMIPERTVVVEHETHYYPAPPSQYGDTYYAPQGRVWIPGQYLPEGGGRYIYVPGHWEN